MQEDVIIQISSRIKEKRKAMGLTVQELADKAAVSKGLISQIENNRTVPSLLVLVSIIHALELDVSDFFNGIRQAGQVARVLVVRSDAYTLVEKESTKGISYRRVLTRGIRSGAADVMLLEIKAGARRSQLVQSEAYEFRFVISGTVEYFIDNQAITLYKGDAIFFDGRVGHKPSNNTGEDALLLAIYFYQETE